MELYLKRYFWVLHLAVIVACAVFAARGVNQWLEAKYLVAAKEPARTARPKAARPPEKPSTAPSKDAEAVARRNVFCSTCEPPKPETPTSTSTVASDPDHPPPTSLPLLLVATSIARDEALSAATIVNTGSQKSGMYWFGEDIPGAGRIVRIERAFVDFENHAASRVERLDIRGANAPRPPTPTVAATATPPAPGDELTAELDKGVKKIDDTHYEIDRALVDKVLADPNLVVRSARIVPSIKDGKANGFKMYAIRPSSLHAKIGLENGDTVHTLNGQELTSPEKALDAYAKLAAATSITIGLTRRGAPLTLELKIK